MGLQREAPGSTLSLSKEPKTKMGKQKAQPTTGQKENLVASCQGNLEKGAEGHQVFSSPHLRVAVFCRNVSFAFGRITESREFDHLALQIMRLVVMSPAQGCLPERARRSWHPAHTSSSVSPSLGHRHLKEAPFPH